LLKGIYPSLRSKTDDYVFSALCVKANFYKNPSLVLNESDFAEIIVDSPNDGGADILLSDPNSETADLVIGQSKFYKSITSEQVLNAVRKMADFYNDMTAGDYEKFNSQVKSRFLTVYSEVSEESKIHFVFYTSAPHKKSIDRAKIKKKFLEQFIDSSRIEVSIMFVNDIKKEIEEAEAQRPTVENGKILIDKIGNVLLYNNDIADAAIVNVSAFSIKNLYETHGINLLSLNLRYHINGGKIDKEIRETIVNKPESFWLKNNGITIICDDFRIDGREVHLKNFSIVNGGQTTYMIDKSKSSKDFWLSCKIIKTAGTTEKEKNIFSLEIAKAANAQKPIKDADLKANAPEQRSFAQSMRAIGIFYQTKRGEKIQSQFVDSYLHTKLLDIGKLCLAAIFQLPCKSRSKPSSVYSPEYYDQIFNGNQSQVAQICKELLYIDYYFTKKFLPKFDRDNKDLPDAADRISFAHISRTICIAFTALAARYYQNNLTDKDVTALTSSPTTTNVYKMLCNLGDMKSLLPINLYTDAYDEVLDNLFGAIIEEGVTIYSLKRDGNENNNKSLTAANFLKNDENYYLILRKRWSTLKKNINKIFSEI